MEQQAENRKHAPLSCVWLLTGTNLHRNVTGWDPGYPIVHRNMVTVSRMSQIMFEKFPRPQCQISTFFPWLEREQWMEHKVEQNLNKTSATDLGGQEPDPEWFGFLSLAPITPRRVPCLRRKSESEYFDSKCYYFYFLWIWIEWVVSTRVVSSSSLTFSNFLI